MARPIKESLTYFPLHADFFSDRKIKRLLKMFGGKGVTIYIFVLCEVYRNNGYFLQYDKFYLSDIADALGAGFNKNLVFDAISFCLNTGLFDKSIFDSYGILTSKGIQKRYLSAKESSAKRSYNLDELFLPELCCIHDENNALGLCGEERGRTGKNRKERRKTGKNGVIPPKESKVNKSKVKESKENEKNIFNAEAFGVKTQPDLQPTIEFPDCLKTSAFETAWFDWIDYKKQRRETYKSAGAKALLKKLAEFGPDEAIRKIETAMANNWAGCVFDSPKKQNRNDTSSVISSVAERLKRIESGATEQ